jgi:integrase/recombinase XerD
VEVKAYLDMDQAARLEEVAPCLRDKLMFRVCRVLGPRISEVLNIAVEDIDFAKRQITIIHQKARIKLTCPYCGARLSKKDKACGQCAKLVPEKVKENQERRRLRTIPVDQETLDMMQKFIKKGGPVEKNGRRYLFPITRNRAWQIFRECSMKLGLPEIMNQETGRVHHVSPHRSRDAFGTYAAKMNPTWEGMRLLQEMMGHEDIATTAKYQKIAGVELATYHDNLFKEKK